MRNHFTNKIDISSFHVTNGVANAILKNYKNRVYKMIYMNF